MFFIKQPPGQEMNKCLKEAVKKSRGVSLVYLNIPFCHYKCHFCCFCRKFGPDILSIKKLKASYLQAVKREVAIKGFYFTTKHDVDLKAINFGGGTPTLLTVEELHDLLSSILRSFGQKIDKIKDISIETTPDSLTPAILKELKSVGFNRISIGAQTFNQRILNRLNRKHSVEEFYTAYDCARSAGFKNINVDLLYMLPSQTFGDLKKDLSAAVDIDPEHISPSPVSPVKSPLFNQEFDKHSNVTGEQLRWVRYVHEFLEEKGYNNYFHKYFSKIGKESVTELVYFYDLPFVGIGAGSFSWQGTNPSTIKSYIAKPLSEGLFTKKTPRNPLRGIFKMLLFPEGIHIPYFNQRYDCDIERLIENPELELNFFKKLENCSVETLKKAKEWQKKAVERIKRWKREGIIEKDSDYLRISPAARFSKETWGLYMSSI
jgi:oxygen-independent coproporphyrinogen-3 oxidase